MLEFLQGRAARVTVTAVAIGAVAGGAAAHLHSGKTVTLTVDGASRTVDADADTVQALLADEHVPVSSRDIVAPGLNTPVKDGRFEFVVASVSCGHASVSRAFVSRSAQGQFCLVALSVRNVGTKSQTFADAFQKANAPTGDSYAADTTAGLLANTDGANVWTLINPGNKVSGTIVFDIPAAGTISTVELHDSALSHGVIVNIA